MTYEIPVPFGKAMVLTPYGRLYEGGRYKEYEGLLFTKNPYSMDKSTFVLANKNGGSMSGWFSNGTLIDKFTTKKKPTIVIDVE